MAIDFDIEKVFSDHNKSGFSPLEWAGIKLQ